MNAADVLDHQADLIVRLSNPILRRAWGGQIELDRQGWVGRPDGKQLPAPTAHGAAVIDALTHALPEAAAYYVTPDMTQMVAWAAADLNGTDRITRTFAPTRTGIARFDSGLPFQDVRGQAMKISWLVWGPTIVRPTSRHDVGEPEEATSVWLFNDHRDEPDVIFAQLAKDFEGPDASASVDRIMGRWGLITWDALFEGQRLGPKAIEAPPAKQAEVQASGGIPTPFSSIPRLIHAFWLLLEQTVTDVSEAHLDRPRRKRAGRAGLPPRVTIIRLRNIAARQQPGESLVEWSHRWPVRGHWRWQVCGPHHALAQELEPGKWRARIWIAPQVRGPKDKPLIVSQKVYSLQR